MKLGTNYLLDTKVNTEVRSQDPGSNRDQTLDNRTGVVTPLSDKSHHNHILHHNKAQEVGFLKIKPG